MLIWKFLDELKLNQIAEVLPPKYKPSFIFKSKKRSVTIPSKTKRTIPTIFNLYLFDSWIHIFTNLIISIPSLMFDFMGLFFIVFSFFKFLDYNGFALHSHNTILLRKGLFIMEIYIHLLKPYWE